MFGIIYLILAGVLGYEASKILTQDDRTTAVNRIWLMLPASFASGVLLMTWAVYLVSWAASAIGSVKAPLFYGNMIVMTATALLLAALFLWRRRSSKSLKIRSRLHQELILDRKRFRWEMLLFGVLILLLTYMMFYVFFIRDGILYSGVTVYGDYAPHTAMMRSFSEGNNFPTQYPHYGGADVKYHFMFQFLTGNLEYLGMRLDIAYNLVSVVSLLGFLMLLYQLALRITGKMCCGVCAIFFFFFRSGAAFFRFVWEHLQAGDLLWTLKENTSFIGYTLNEDWGLWNFNVYLNQRHLAFGLLLVALALYLFMDWLEAGVSHEEKGIYWMKGRIFSKEAWKSRNLEQALMMGLFLGLCAFWNGAAVIGGLLILLGFAVFSDGKIDYAVTAGVTVFFSFLQTKIFIVGSAMSPELYFGFLAEEKTIVGVIRYLFWMGGIFFLGLLILGCFLKRRDRSILVSFLFPTFFAFLISMTPDINVNHKYIMISYAFLAIFWAWAVCKLWDGIRPNIKIKLCSRVTAVILAVVLSATGIYDFVVILKANGPGHRVAVNTQSELTAWLEETLDKDDLLLTPEYSMNEVTMSGAMLYCGWPYYAWSAGYDTNYRAAQAVMIYTTSDSELLKRVTEQEKITYILFEEGSEFEQQPCREDVIAASYEKVYETRDGRIRIYQTT